MIGAAQGAIAKGDPKLVRISNDRIQSDDDVEQHVMSCASNGTIELFIQPYSPSSALCVLGTTPAADEARFLAERLRIRLADSPRKRPSCWSRRKGRATRRRSNARSGAPQRTCS